MKQNLDMCGFEGCKAAAYWRGEMIYPKEKVARCMNHTGHHEFTEVHTPDGWMPIDYASKQTGLPL